jgi:alkylhydroperoxidase/carboxymuconolactone decarboxylase family protein YurZ
MKLFGKDLPPETQILIAMGSAVAAGCQPCLEKIVALAQSEELDKAQMRAAVSIGQYIKDQPAAHMKALADELVGTNLSTGSPQNGCGCGSTADTQNSCTC